jgi:carbon storage regulator
MLMLSRRENEGFVIADRITVKVVEIRGGHVRLAIEAPKEVRMLRTELVNAAAATIVAA